MKKLLIALVGAVLVLGACGDNNNNNDPAPNDTPANNEANNDNAANDNAANDDAANDNAAAGEYDEVAAAAAFGETCAGCHGEDLQGGGAYAEPISGKSADEVLAKIQGGAHMGADVGENEANVAEWVSKQ